MSTCPKGFKNKHNFSAFLYYKTFPVKSLVMSFPQPLFFLKGLSHEIDFKNFDKNLQNLA
jgi:hypothetical protein